MYYALSRQYLYVLFSTNAYYSVFLYYLHNNNTIFNEYLRVIFTTFEIGFDAAEDGPLNVCETLAKVVEKI